jgi:hypothetical protein
MAESVIKSYFPSQVASDVDKASPEYGLKVAKAIEQEWFKADSGTNRFYSNQNTFHKLRLYARGEQSIQKYKDELAINGDLSYLNLDWKQVPIIPKFVDILVNGISERLFKLKAYSQDPFGISKRTDYMESVLRDLQTKELTDFAGEAFGVNLAENNPDEMPGSKEELELHMLMSYKQGAEVAEEAAINTIFAGQKYDDIKKRVVYDLVVIGIGCTKNRFTKSEGIRLEYVDPANLVYSYTESPFFDDIYYIGEIKTIVISELKKEFPELEQEEMRKITEQGVQSSDFYHRTATDSNNVDSNSVQVLYFNYKTYMNEVYKVKETGTGASKIIVKDDSFNPPEGLEGGFEKISRSIEVLYEGVMILGTNQLLKWEMAANMVRPKSNYTKVKMNYSICAPRMYKGRIESTVGRITGFADAIQLTHLKIQQVSARIVPDGIYLDADGLAEIDLGNGTNYNPAEALNMFFQTGSVIGRSYTADGDMNPGKIPIQEIQSGSGNNKIQSLINLYNFNLQMIRDATGLNEARDASTPDPKALVGVQKLAAANSNTATRHILQSSLFITVDTAECISLRISDVLEYSPTRETLIQSIGAHNVGMLDELAELHLRDFAIFIELEPDEEEKQMLEQNIQIALSKNLIDLDHAIDIREIRSLKVANLYLKLSKKKKAEADQLLEQQRIQAQSQADQQTQQVIAQAEIQKQQAIATIQKEVEQLKGTLGISKLEKEVALKRELMLFEFQLNMQLKDKEAEVYKSKESLKEDRKDYRGQVTDNRKATQQSQLIDQRTNGKGPKNFESSDNDVIGGGFNLGSFDPT